MWRRRRDVLESIVLSALGAAVGIGLSIINGGKPDLRLLMTSFFIGAAAGFLVDLAAKLIRELETALTSLNLVQSLLMIEAMPFDLLKRAQPQQAVLLDLLKLSIKGQAVAKVGRPQYLHSLQAALKSSSKFQGIHRLPIRAFFDGTLPAEPYKEHLRVVCAARIPRLRLFIIDMNDKPAMEEDVHNPDLLTQYWRETGNVRSYWIEAGQLSKLFPRDFESIPESFALFDSALLIKYREALQTLEFDVVEPDARESKLFEACIADKTGSQFQIIPGPKF